MNMTCVVVALTAAASISAASPRAETTSTTSAAATKTTGTADTRVAAPATRTGTTSDTLPPYGLRAGSHLEYVTSASLVVGGMMPQEQSLQFTQAYTVLDIRDDVRTMYVAVDPKAEPTTRSLRRQTTPPARFTFQLIGDGELGATVAGFSRALFPGWSPAIDFPTIPREETSTVTLHVPFMDRPTEVRATRSASGVNVLVNYLHEPPAAAWESSGLHVKSYRAAITYSPADQCVLAARYEARAEGMTMQGTVPLSIAFETTRAAATTMAAAQLDSLRKEVSEGIQLSTKLQAVLSGVDMQVTAAQSLLRDYLKTHATGEFVPIFRLIDENLVQIARMNQMKKNAALVISGKPAPGFEAKTLEGETIRLADLKGKVVLLDFWATWCGPCVAEVPAMKKIWEAHKDKGFAMVGISGDQDEQSLQDFIKSRDLSWKHIYQPEDDESTVIFKYGVEKLPTTILIDRDGIIRAVDLRGERLVRAVAKLVSGEILGPMETGPMSGPGETGEMINPARAGGTSAPGGTSVKSEEAGTRARP